MILLISYSRSSPEWLKEATLRECSRGGQHVQHDIQTAKSPRNSSCIFCLLAAVSRYNTQGLTVYRHTRYTTIKITHPTPATIFEADFVQSMGATHKNRTWWLWKLSRRNLSVDRRVARRFLLSPLSRFVRGGVVSITLV